MDAQAFVTAIKEVVINESVRSVQENLYHPPGRKPSEVLRTQSEWYNKLNNNDKQILIQIITESIDTAVFGFLCVLDGVRAIENGEKGKFKLYYEKAGEQTFLNDDHSEMLHDLL